MKVAVGCVVYQKAIPYLKDFLCSLEKQDTDQFDVIILNDDIESNDLKEIFGKYEKIWGEKLIIIEGKVGHAPYELRIQLFEYVKEAEYDLLVLCDADDMLSSERVGNTIKTFSNEFTFYYNELLTMSGEQCMPSMPDEILNYKDIAEHNFLGLSNNAFNMKNITKEFLNSLYQGRTNVFDWYLFSRLLLCGYKGKKVKGSATYYRIHDNNLAGISRGTIEELNKEIGVKCEHYKLMAKHEVYFEELLKKYRSLNDEQKRKLCTTGQHFWWGILQIERKDNNV